MLKAPYKMAASSKDKRTPITTPLYKVPSVDVTPDLSTFSLDITLKFNPVIASPTVDILKVRKK
jgi:hypothetical protein